VVRSGDLCSITGAAFTGFYNQSEGTFFAQSTKVSTNSNSHIINANANAGNNIAGLRYATSNTSVAAMLDSAGSSQLTGLSANVTAGSSPKQAFAYKLNDCAYSVNGATVITDTSALLPAVNLSQLNIGSAHNSAPPLFGHIASIRYFKKRLANAKLQTLTA
jgi:hypothetical protein